QRQLDCAMRAKTALQECMDAIALGLTLDAVSVSLDGCLEALFELSGKRVTEQVADGVFHQFCVGK
ncbi:MAG: tRNA uridine-5-carboxymethylaminomethyl(34) synthesis GTPase MnmE, partial [Clostridia bacterium]|nr:tRNA uridine-5-carboxymethylaminomethyl(34) synthesis GTPase MnmE [Clostridia bacterium]